MSRCHDSQVKDIFLLMLQYTQPSNFDFAHFIYLRGRTQKKLSVNFIALRLSYCSIRFSFDDSQQKFNAIKLNLRNK